LPLAGAPLIITRAGVMHISVLGTDNDGGTPAGGPAPGMAGVLLAAGASRRYGRPKLLEPWRGEPIVRWAARSLLGGGLDPVVVVVPPGRSIRDALRDCAVTFVENADEHLGLGHSIACGVSALPPGVAAALISVADQPLVDAQVVRRLWAAFRPGGIVVARFGEHLGNPRLFDRKFFPALAALTGEVGGQAVAAHHPDALIEVPLSPAIGRDIDRPEDLAELSET